MRYPLMNIDNLIQAFSVLNLYISTFDGTLAVMPDNKTGVESRLPRHIQRIMILVL